MGGEFGGAWLCEVACAAAFHLDARGPHILGYSSPPGPYTSLQPHYRGFYPIIIARQWAAQVNRKLELMVWGEKPQAGWNSTSQCVGLVHGTGVRRPGTRLQLCLYEVVDRSLSSGCLPVSLGSRGQRGSLPQTRRGLTLSVGKESTAMQETLVLIPGLGRSAGKGIGYPLQSSWELQRELAGFQRALACFQL